MAKFWKHLKYHDDEIEKRSIKPEEIQFLLELQKEMNTQDVVGQADPRYWTIKDYFKIYGQELAQPDGCEIYIDDILIYGKASRPDAIEIVEIVKRWLLNHAADCSKADLDDILFVDDLEELLERKCYDFRILDYALIPTYNGFFLTQKAAAEHLKKYEYNYGPDACTYAMTAFRSPEAEMLYKILHEVDFSKLNKDAVEHGVSMEV
jgi:hypothetical protein